MAFNECPTFTIFHKLWLLIWKNMLLRRRHYIITSLEILLPTICAIIIAYSNRELMNAEIEQNGGFGIGGTGGSKLKQVREKTYQPISEEALMSNLRETLHCPDDGCPYAPANKHTQLIMQEILDTLSELGYYPNFFGMPSEKDIEDLIVKHSTSLGKPVFSAAIIFQSGFPVTGNKNDRLVSYKIRLKYEYSTYLSKLGSEPIMPVDDTGNLFPQKVLDPGTHNGEKQKMSYVQSGFLGLQIAIDQALIKYWTGKEISEKISLQPFPIPTHIKREEGITLAYLFHSIVLPTFLVLGFIFIVPSIMRGVVGEKECGIRELLKMNGLPGWLQWIGWLINSMMILILSVTIVIILLFLGTVQYGDPGVWYFILLLYMVAATSFCFFISAFFVRPSLAITVGIILWLITYFPIFIVFELYPSSITFGHKLLASLLPNVAFYLAAKIMMTYERDGVGAQWDNVSTPVNPGQKLSLLYIMMMFILSSVLYVLLTAYLDNVLVADFGVRKPWYYPFMPSTWGINIQTMFKKSKVDPEIIATDTEDRDLPPGFEQEPVTGEIGIQLINLRKVYDRHKVAVDNVNLNMYHGEIFVLLGYNGAGKTTTISMLTGICAPSGGTAMINGYSISRQLKKVRQNLGLCPQNNMLFERLTVHEHLLFFGQLKGLTRSSTSQELEIIMKKLQIWDKKDTLSKDLSGGQKRKLHLGIALIGNSRVTILDEPTSGMDPEARRAIWDVLLEIRDQRTTLLTTHFMEEADVLGDRIGIMASGKIQCCGTPSFLKQFYGAGYTLKLTLSIVPSTTPSLTVVPVDSDYSLLSTTSSKSRAYLDPIDNTASLEILLFVQKHVPDAFLKDTRSANPSEVFIILPKGTSTTSVLTELFSDLSKEKDHLGIQTVGMSPTTVDEVFLRVGELSEGSHPPEEGDIEDYIQQIVHHTSFKLVLSQFIALLIKKILYTFRKRKLTIAQVIIPIILLICAIICCNGFFAPSGHPVPRIITLDAYDKPIVPIFTDTDERSDTVSLLTSYIGSPARVIKTNNANPPLQKLLMIGNKSLELYTNHYILGVHVEGNISEELNVFYSTVPNHAAPLAVNIASNLFLKKLGPPGTDLKIQVTNHPLRTDIKLVLGSAKPDIEYIFYATILFEVFMPFGLALLAATFIVLPMEEKLCKAKQLQMMTGVHPCVYWGSAFLWDFFIVTLVVCAMICCFPIFQSHEMYTSYGGAWAAFIILMVYGLCAISFSYLMSHFAKTVSGGFAFVTIIHIISGLVIGIVVSAMDMMVVFSPTSPTRAGLQLFGRLFPTYGAVVRYVETAIDNGRCNILKPETKKLLCDNPWKSIKTPSVWEYLECCEFCQKAVDKLQGKERMNLVSLSPECFVPKPYIEWETPRETLKGTTISVPGIGQELMHMLIMCVVYLILLFLMEYLYFIREKVDELKNKGPEQIPQFEPTEETDEDVAEEAKRIKENIGQRNFDEDALIIQDLRKTFKSFAAVKKISFGVHHGECFGLLGINGAGKTTTFRMLTGDEIPTSGVLYAFAKSLKKDRTQYLLNIGYCPQFDGVIGVLTGKEMLQLFSKLRGITGETSNMEADRWLKKLGLFKSAQVQCSKYSGGMKRRLCAAIAMIGDPSIILLDEPTSGVDPVSRHKFWKVLQSVRKSGQAIILTSHSMEECEALCSRLGIMVNGELQCLGGVQHLKNKFAQGYTLALKLTSLVSADSELFQHLHTEIMERFKPCVVKDKHNNFIQYEIYNIALSWEFLFRTMEELKKIHEELIEDYSLNETTLEEVFLSFARKQYGGRKVHKRCCC